MTVLFILLQKERLKFISKEKMKNKMILRIDLDL